MIAAAKQDRETQEADLGWSSKDQKLQAGAMSQAERLKMRASMPKITKTTVEHRTDVKGPA